MLSVVSSFLCQIFYAIWQHCVALLKYVFVNDTLHSVNSNVNAAAALRSDRDSVY